MRVIRKRGACAPVQSMLKEETAKELYEVPVDVEDSAHSQWLVFWDLGERALKVERFVTCPDDWQPHKECGKPVIITESNCEAMLFMPGQYRISMVDDGPIPDDITYEKTTVTRETVELWLLRKRACCCE